MILLSAVFWALIIQAGHIAGGGGHYVEGLMWCPAIAALAGHRLQALGYRRRWAWPPSADGYALLGYVTPLVYALIAYALVWGLGLGGFPNPAAIAALSARLGWHVGNALFVPLYFILIATTGMIGSTARALGEEIGWRGFMAPRMVAQWGFTKGAVVAGVIWAAWHMPLLLFADYNSGTPWWFALSCFTVFVIASSVMLTWIRLKSQSVWPCAILHASHNLFIQTFFTPVTAPHGAITAYAIDEFGVATPAVALVIAFLFWRARDQVASA